MSSHDVSKLLTTVVECWQREQITPRRARILEAAIKNGQAHGDLRKLMAVQAELLAAQRLPPIRPDH
jgi:hypothetical protein